MDHVAVVFTKAGAKIYHGINPESYVGRTDVLIDPVFPKGVPPHLWKLVDGKIQGTEGPKALPRKLTERERALIAALVTCLICLILTKMHII
jgi:hypothetical protein